MLIKLNGCRFKLPRVKKDPFQIKRCHYRLNRLRIIKIVGQTRIKLNIKRYKVSKLYLNRKVLLILIQCKHVKTAFFLFQICKIYYTWLFLIYDNVFAWMNCSSDFRCKNLTSYIAYAFLSSVSIEFDLCLYWYDQPYCQTRDKEMKQA